MKIEDRKFIWRAIALALVIAIAGPEMGLGLEAFAVLQLLGVEMVLLSFLVGLRLLPIWHVMVPIRRWIEKRDPYFYLPNGSQIKSCPGIVCHAVPGLIATYFAILAWGIV